MKDIFCSVAICTHNRPEKLARCLSSLQFDLNVPVEVLLIDNSKEQSARDVFANYEHKVPGIKYIHEAKIGLGHARNRAIQESLGEFIFYLDDDAWVEDKFFSRLLDIIKNEKYHAFGAYVKGHFNEDDPKWLRNSYYHPEPFLEERGLLINGYLQGGASAYRTDILRLSGGFNTDLGMKGMDLAYGEDTELEKRLRSKGFLIGFDPDLVVHHEIRYTSIRIILKSYYRRALTFYSLNESMILGQVWRSILSGIYQSAKAFITNGIQAVSKRSAGIQNMYLESIFPLQRAYSIFKVAGPQYFNYKRSEFRRDSTSLDLLLNILQRKVKDVFFVQVGACDGVLFDPINKLVKKHQWKGITVEPLPQLADELRSTYLNQPDVQVVPLAIAKEDGNFEISYVSGDKDDLPVWTKGIASLLPERNALNPLFSLNDEWKDDIVQTVVPALSWKSFLKTYNVNKLDLLVLDIEGMEYEVLKQIENLPAMVIFEFTNLPMDELNWIKERFNNSDKPYFLIQYSQTDYMAVQKSIIPFLVRLKLNLPIVR